MLKTGKTEIVTENVQLFFAQCVNQWWGVE